MPHSFVTSALACECRRAILVLLGGVCIGHVSPPAASAAGGTFVHPPLEHGAMRPQAVDTVWFDERAGFTDFGSGCGRGKEPTPEEEQNLRDCFLQLGADDYTLLDGTFVSGVNMATDLQAMLDKDRLGAGRGSHGVYGCNMGMGAPGVKDDWMNISPKRLAECNPELCCTLAHEWMHTQQPLTMSKACKEAQAYALGMQVYLLTGGDFDSYYWGRDALQKKYAAGCPAWPSSTFPTVRTSRHATPVEQGDVLPNSSAPIGGGAWDDGSFDNSYGLNQTLGEVFLWKGGIALDTHEPLPYHLFFDVRHVAFPDHDVVLVFGSDTTASSSPAGVLTAFSADETHLFDRQEIPLTGVRHPCSVDQDALTGKWYVLDGHASGGGITIWQDTDGDGIPDSPNGSPFAPAGTPALTNATSIRLADHPTHGSGVIVATEDLRLHGWHDYADSAEFLMDTDHDDVADASVKVPVTDFVEFPPVISQIPGEGAVELQVVGMTGHLLEVWRCDSSGDVLQERLGGTIGDPEGVNTILLSTPLVAGWYVEALDLTLPARVPTPTLVVGPLTVPTPSWTPRVGLARPNPAHGSATLSFEVPARAFVRSALYDIAGRVAAHVVTGWFEQGGHVLTWRSPVELPSGVYIWRLSIDGLEFRRTLIIAR